MSKAKDAVSDLRSKLFDRKKEEVVEAANEKIESELESTVYDLIQDPTSKSRSFLSVKIKYNLTTKQAVVTDIRPFDNKTAGLSFIMDKENRRYLFEKGNK